MWRYRRDHTVDVFQNLVVPEAQDSVAFALKEARALRVIRGVFRMLPAISLHDQLCRMRTKIREIAAHRHLLPKLHVRKSFS